MADIDAERIQECSAPGCSRPCEPGLPYCAEDLQRWRPRKRRTRERLEVATEPQLERRVCGHVGCSATAYGDFEFCRRHRPPRLCSVRGCGRLHHARGFCSRHYGQAAAQLEDAV